MKIAINNKKARYNFHILETYEAGIILKGTEVKSIRAGHMTLDESYVVVRSDKLVLMNSYIKEYEQGNQFNHETNRMRELLAHKKEILKMATAVERKGHTLVPLKLYFKGQWAKLEIGVAESKNKRDKREVHKKRDANREIARALKMR